MEFNIILKTARSITFELNEKSIYHAEIPYEVYINDELVKNSDKIVESIYDLKPSTTYTLYVKNEKVTSAPVEFRTDDEFVTLNVRDFGAAGDGKKDDTIFIQAAILSCPKGGRVFIPKGTYKVTSLFLKSDLVLEIGKGAHLSAFTDRSMFPILPGLIESNNEKEEYYLGSWEGNRLDTFASIITGINVSNILIYGEGIIDGQADFDNWWDRPKDKIGGAYRPRMIFLNNCSNVVVNSFYFCDPDGRTQYVSSEAPLPVDERTPKIKNLVFTNIICENAHYCGAYIAGLPEQKIQSITMNHVRISYAAEAEIGQSAMMTRCTPTAKLGIYMSNVEEVTLNDVEVIGAVGEPIIIE